MRSCPVAHLEILAAEGEEVNGAGGCSHGEVRGGRSGMGQQTWARVEVRVTGSDTV